MTPKEKVDLFVYAIGAIAGAVAAAFGIGYGIWQKIKSAKAEAGNETLIRAVQSYPSESTKDIRQHVFEQSKEDGTVKIVAEQVGKVKAEMAVEAADVKAAQTPNP